MMKKITCTIFSVFLSSVLYSQKSLELNKGNVYVSPKTHLYMKNGLNADANTQLVADSDAAHSSSLLFDVNQTQTAALSGEVVYKRALTREQWYAVGAPVTDASQTVGQLAADSSNEIKKTADNKTFAIGVFNPRAENYAWAYHNTGTTYDNSKEQWSDLTSTVVESGKGLSIKTSAGTGVAKISFKGDVKFSDGTFVLKPFDSSTDQISVNGKINGFNSLANPFPSFFNLASLFSVSNESKLDANSLGVYVSNSGGIYTFSPKNTLTSLNLHPGQAFLVKAGDKNTASVGLTPTLTYSRTDQRSQSTSVFSRSQEQLVEVKLHVALDNGKKDYTRVFYNSNCNEELNPGWEGESFSPNTNFSVHTRYANVEAYAQKDLDVQCVKNDYNDNVIPLSVYAPAGKTITFSSEKLNLPSSVNLFIEDRINNTIEKITDESYVVNLSRDVKGKGNFYLHSSPEGTLTIDDLKNTSVEIFKANTNTLRISGLKQGVKSLLTVYAINGQEVLSNTFVSESISNITLPTFSTGIYLVKVSQDSDVHTKKIIID